MKPYGKNDKESNFKGHQGQYWCNCYLCIPVKKNSKKSERQKEKLQIKKNIDSIE